MTRIDLSVLAAVDTAFAMLMCEPGPLTFDTTPISGLPDRRLPLGELRDLVVARRLDGDATDALWRHLALHAREHGPAWVVGAVGMALPGLTRMAARLARSNPRHAEDIASELLAGFLHALRTEDLDRPRLWHRLCWAGWRAGFRVVQTHDTAELPLDVDTGSRQPQRPYGHPDLILGRAVAAGVLTAAQAELISCTRLGDVLVEDLATAHGVSAPVVRMRRKRAERVLVAAIGRGDLSVPQATRRRAPQFA